jgi:bidirectional [NiFe] hydrogenase diaphorase subunit
MIHPQLFKAPPPTDDRRWRIVETVMRRQGYAPDALIEALHAVQQTFGYLDDASLRYVGTNLGVAPSKVYGVATFYHHFSLKPAGEHTCVVCTGTACYIKGSAALLSAIREQYDVRSGETTADGELSLLTARCLGMCGLAPAVVLDGQVAGLMSPAELRDRLGALVHPTEPARP